MNLAFELNGKPVSLDIEPRETLAEVLRHRCRLLGVKLSCEAQVCGTCTVLVDNLPVSSCTYLAYEVRGRRVVTIEGLADDNGRLHPLQQAFLDNFAFQCGFCTPGMIMTAKALLNEIPSPSEEQVKEALSGNFCRCISHYQVIRAIMSLPQRGDRS